MFKKTLTATATVAAAVALLAGTTFAQSTKVDPKTDPKTDAKTEPVKKAETAKTLKIGDKAPAISVESWIKGDPITGYESGRVYVVEFWATWCGPCIAQMPHLSKLAANYKDKGVAVIGVNIWEREYDETTLDSIKEFVAQKGDTMGYTVAFDGPAKAMDMAYMKAAKRRGIPSTFVVDGESNIAWIGHPMWLDTVVESVVDGSWDYETSPAALEAVQKELSNVYKLAGSDPEAALAALDAIDEKFPTIGHQNRSLRFNILLSSGSFDKAYAFGGELVTEAIEAKDSNALNSLAWTIVSPDAEFATRDLDLAHRAADAANSMTGNEDPMIMDTLARVYFMQGQIDKAIELQTKAIELVPERAKAQYTKALDEYKAAEK